MDTYITRSKSFICHLIKAIVGTLLVIFFLILISILIGSISYINAQPYFGPGFPSLQHLKWEEWCAFHIIVTLHSVEAVIYAIFVLVVLKRLFDPKTWRDIVRKVKPSTRRQ